MRRYAIPFLSWLSKKFSLKEWLQINHFNYTKLLTLPKRRGTRVRIHDKANFRAIERFFQRIKNYRHIAIRYDKLAVCFKNFVLLAAFAIHF